MLNSPTDVANCVTSTHGQGRCPPPNLDINCDPEGQPLEQYPMLKKLGCWGDRRRDRAIPSLERTDPRLDGKYRPPFPKYRSRINPVEKCYKVAKDRGYKVFAVQDKGQCLSFSYFSSTTYKITCVVLWEGQRTTMDVFTVTVATVITVLSAVVIVVYLCQRTAQSPSWPKSKQPLAYLRKVTPKKIRLQLPLNSLDDFIPVGEATEVHDVVRLFARRGNEFSVYSIDWEQEVAVLVRPVDGVDLKEHPFFLDAQRENAAEVLCVPLERLHDMASAVTDKVAHVREVFIFHTARCGTTLVTRLVEATSVAQAMSEPEVFSVISMALYRLKQSSQHGQTTPHHDCPVVLSNEESTIALLKNVVTLMNYNLVTSDPRHRDVIVYKIKPDNILLGDLMARAFPSAKTVFMYRDGLEISESFARVLLRQRYVLYLVFWLMVRLGLVKLIFPFPDFLRCFGDDLKFSAVRLRGNDLFYIFTRWVGVMQCAADLQKKQPGYFFHAVIYYSALVNNKEETFRLLMEKLGLKWSSYGPGEDTDKIEKALTEDSQAGTSMCAKGTKPGEKWVPDVSSRWMGQWEQEYFGEVCRHNGNEIPGPDFLLPGTIV
ncbi:Hypp2752 [Branchiostoma lanceolatum]|uniref:Hypp2752 protein n=1 Tax=Branchiostoma lanceolatum TaxID=7740 RepID=A0A8J9ZU89_BRALA|nr:Hypp2752 [Branchiostoma lanceolatum]